MLFRENTESIACHCPLSAPAHGPPDGFIHTPALAVPRLELSSPKYPYSLLFSQFLLSCHLFKEAFPSPYLNLQPPPSNPVLPAPSPRFICFSKTCINLQSALYFTDLGVYVCLHPIL